MIKEFDSFRTDDEGTFYYYKDKNGVENEWSYDLDELEYYIKSNEEEIKRLTKRLEEAQLGYLAVDKKNKRLHSIIKEVRELINYYGITPDVNDDRTIRIILKQFLEILDKENKDAKHN